MSTVLVALLAATLIASLFAMGRRARARRAIHRTRRQARCAGAWGGAAAEQPPGDPPSQARLVDALHEAVVSTSRDGRILEEAALCRSEANSGPPFTAPGSRS